LQANELPHPPISNHSAWPESFTQKHNEFPTEPYSYGSPNPCKNLDIIAPSKH
jgi:hypothetical protein